MKKVLKADEKLLSRDEFREGVFTRDKHKCVICGEPGVDAHHILERRLFSDGGYYLSNGATLCAKHHIQAEETTLSVEQIREAAGIVAATIPEHFYPDTRYDKWGNTYLTNGQRTKGELFNDESVQKILAQGKCLHEFTDYIKYPRTWHLPWSPGATSDDRVLHNLSKFENEVVVVTKKMDGENTSLYKDYYHARSIDSESHPSQSWARGYHSQIAWAIPDGWRICAENLYAKHSIAYNDLESFILAFSIWDEKNFCLSWDELVTYTDILGMHRVPVLYHGMWDENYIRHISDDLNPEKDEGYVVRVARKFHYSEFRWVVAKYVRKGHVQTTHHWKAQAIVKNSVRL